jgi:hypothetical protein
MLMHLSFRPAGWILVHLLFRPEGWILVYLSFRPAGWILAPSFHPAGWMLVLMYPSCHPAGWMLVMILACLPQGRRNEPSRLVFLLYCYIRSGSPYMQLILARVTRISLLLALRGLCVCPLVMRYEDLLLVLVIAFTSGHLPLRLTLNVTLRAPRLRLVVAVTPPTSIGLLPQHLNFTLYLEVLILCFTLECHRSTSVFRFYG